jgi:D-alanyl-D-alanine carboxypeptidase
VNRQRFIFLTLAILLLGSTLSPLAFAAKKGRGVQATEVTLNYAKTQKRVRASGKLSPPVPNAEIDVTLEKRKSGSFQTVATRSPQVDGEGRYSTRLRRPRMGKCRLTASYEGDATNDSSSADKTFDCGVWVHMVAYSPEQLPGNAERAVEKIDGVKATTAMSGSLFLKSSRTRSGSNIDSPPGNYTIPLDVAFINPEEYARFARDKDKEKIRSLDNRRVVLSNLAAELRDGHAKLKMKTTVGRFKSLGAVSNSSAQGYEVLVPKPAPNQSVAFRTVLIEKPADVSRKRIARKVRKVAGNKPVEIGTEKEVPFLRHGQLVRPQMFVKEAFGEFAMRPSSGRSISIQHPWASQNIRADNVPVLGRVTCHRKIFPQLRKAMRELKRKGLAHTARESNYAGCFNPRFISSYDNSDVGPVRRLSRHAWGIALDINAGNNPFGRKPNQDRRLVRIMKKWGFTWGGKWALPDGMHFEWERFP